MAVCRCDRDCWRLVVGVSHRDRGGLGGEVVGAVRERDRDVVDVVGVEVGWALVIRSCCPYDGADLAADAGGEVRRIVPGQRARVGARGVGVGDGVGLEGRSCGLGMAVCRCDRDCWRLVVGVCDCDCIGRGCGVVGAVADSDGVCVHVVGVAVRCCIVVRGRGPGHCQCGSADRAAEVVGVVAGLRARERAHGVSVGDRETVDRRSAALGDRHGGRAGRVGRCLVVGISD